jgi:hypothetical protein
MMRVVVNRQSRQIHVIKTVVEERKMPLFRTRGQGGRLLGSDSRCGGKKDEGPQVDDLDDS